MIFGITTAQFWCEIISCIITCAGAGMMFFSLFKPKKSYLFSWLVIFAFYIPLLASSIIGVRVGNGEAELTWQCVLLDILIIAWPYTAALTMKGSVVDVTACVFFTNSFNPFMYFLLYIATLVTRMPQFENVAFFKYGVFTTILHNLSFALLLPLVKKYIVSRIDRIPKIVKRGLVILVPVSQIIPICTNYFYNPVFKSDFMFVFLIAFGFSISLVFAISMFYIKEHSKNERLSAALEYENKKYDYFNIIYKYSDKIAKMSHDINNHLRTIQILSEQSNAAECKDYSEKLLNEYTSAITGFCKNATINSMLLYYDRTAKEKRIEFNCNADADNDIPIENMSLVTVFSNILDNAFEAAEKCDEGNRRVTLCISADKNGINSVCENTYSGEIKKKGGKLVTAKSDVQAHGLGTQIVKETVKKYDGISKFDYDSDKFNVSIYIPLAEAVVNV